MRPMTYNSIRRIRYAKEIAKRFNKDDIIDFKEIRILLTDYNWISSNGLYAIFRDGCDLNLFKRLENNGRFPRFIVL